MDHLMTIKNGMILIYNEEIKEYICMFPNEYIEKLPEKTLMYFYDSWKSVKLVNGKYEDNNDNDCPIYYAPIRTRYYNGMCK